MNRHYTSPAAAFAEQAELEHKLNRAVTRAARRFFGEVVDLALRDGLHLSPAAVEEAWTRHLAWDLHYTPLLIPGDAMTTRQLADYIWEEPALRDFHVEVYRAAMDVLAAGLSEGWPPSRLGEELRAALDLDALVVEEEPAEPGEPGHDHGPALVAAGLRSRRSSWKDKLTNAVGSAVTGAQGTLALARFVASAASQRPGVAPTAADREESATPYKRWVTRRDNRVRPAHADADGQTVRHDLLFFVGGFPMAFPGDRTAPAALRANCRCAVVYVSGRRVA